MRAKLAPHPQAATPAIGIDVEAERRAGGRLALRFSVSGAIETLALPRPSSPRRVDGLWRHSCFEAFLRVSGDAGYWEFNLAPSRQWAAYRFSDYRMGMEAPVGVPEPEISTELNDRGFELAATIGMARALGLLAESPWQLGLAAVIEDREGNISHWALAHPPGAPDFHHRDCFALELPPPKRR